MHQEPFAGLERGALEHIVPDGEYGLGQRRRLCHRQPFRDRQRHSFRRHGELGIAAAIDQSADEIALLEPLRARAKGNHLAGDLEPEKV